MARATLDQLADQVSSLWKDSRGQALVVTAVRDLDERYALVKKIRREAGVREVILQMFGRLADAFPRADTIAGLRVLDIACGSNTSREPPVLQIKTPFGTVPIRGGRRAGYAAKFEPWMCRILLELKAGPVGVDVGDLEGERFEHHHADLGRPGALDFLPDASFDALQDSRLFGSPEFTRQFPRRADRLKVAQEIVRQEQRLLKPGGTLIHSDAAGWLE